MAQWTVRPERATLHGQWGRAIEPALWIESGDRVLFEDLLDVAWGIEGPSDAVSPRKKWGPRESPRDDGPALCGPVAVRGAEPGDVLEITLEAIVPGDYGFTWGGGSFFFNASLNEELGLADEMELLRWAIDRESMRARNQLGHSVALQPFLGFLGLAPGGEPLQEAWSPRVTGGNLDCKALVAGTTLLLPVQVEGGLISAGDGHARQGDGEVGGMAIEARMKRVAIEVTLRRDLALSQLRAETPEGSVTFGFDPDLDKAMSMALADMIDLIADRFDVNRHQAIALASVAADLHVTQVVNGVKGVHAILPHGAIEV